MSSGIPVPPPALSPLSHNLLGSANIVTDDKESTIAIQESWTRGVSFSPTGCYEVRGVCYDCPPEEQLEENGCADVITFAPMLLDFYVNLPAKKNTDELDETARELLDIGTSSRLEQLLWEGCASPVDGTIPSLDAVAQTVSVGLAEPTYAELLGTLMAALQSAEGHIGSRGTIYMSPTIAVPLDHQLIERDGGLYTLIGGHQVIVGNFPADQIIGHVGQVDVYLTEPEQMDAGDTVSASNTVYRQFQRTAVVAWNACATFSVETGVGS